MAVVAPSSAKLVERVGTKLVVGTGMAVIAAGLLLTSAIDPSEGYGPIALAMVVLAAGMGLVMAPATEAIMGSLSPAKAGIGSAMNDVVREVGGTLGVAVLGSVLASGYATGMDGATSGLSGEAAAAATDSVGGAHAVAGQLDGDGGAGLVAAANDAFIDAMSTTAGIAAGIALAGALIAAAFLPARAVREPAKPQPSFEAAPSVAS